MVLSLVLSGLAASNLVWLEQEVIQVIVILLGIVVAILEGLRRKYGPEWDENYGRHNSVVMDLQTEITHYEAGLNPYTPAGSEAAQRMLNVRADEIVKRDWQRYQRKRKH